MNNYYSNVIALKNSFGWDIKEWSRRIGIDQRILEQVESGDIDEDVETLNELIELTEKGRNKDTSHLLRFDSPKIIATCIHKGGSGKTTCTMGVAEVLAEMGYNILVVDTDSQMDMTNIFMGDEPQHSKNLYMSIVTGTDIRQQICQTDYDRIDIVPSDTKMSSVEALLLSQNATQSKVIDTFRNIMDGVIKENYYDFVLIDMDKNIGFLSSTILSGCTDVVMVSECAYFHISGAAVMESQIMNVKESSNPELNFLGIIINKVSKRKSIVQQALDGFDEVFPGKRFSNMIRVDANIEKAQWENLPIGRYNHSCNGYKDIKLVTEELLTKIQGV